MLVRNFFYPIHVQSTKKGMLSNENYKIFVSVIYLLRAKTDIFYPLLPLWTILLEGPPLLCSHGLWMPPKLNNTYRESCFWSGMISLVFYIYNFYIAEGALTPNFFIILYSFNSKQQRKVNLMVIFTLFQHQNKFFKIFFTNFRRLKSNF